MCERILEGHGRVTWICLSNQSPDTVLEMDEVEHEESKNERDESGDRKKDKNIMWFK